MESIFILTTLLAFLLAITYFYIRNTYSYWKRRGVPFIEPSFLFGNVKEILLQKESFAEGIRKMYNSSDKPIVGLYAIARPILLIRDKNIIRDVFIREYSSFQSRGFNIDDKNDLMADNIFLQHGEKWRLARTSLSPAFTSGKLKGMFDTINNCTNSLSEFVEQYVNQTRSVEIRDVFARYATNVIASVAFGIEIDCIKNRECEFREKGKRIFEPTFTNAVRFTLGFFSPTLAKLFGIRFADKEVGEFMIDTVKQNFEYRQDNNVQRKDFFQLIMQLKNTGKISDDNDWSAKVTDNNKSLTLEQISAHAFLFFSGGYESSSTTMSYCMYELARNPQVQQLAYEDIVSALEKHDGQLTYESVADMKYMDNCIQETLRMHAPFGILTRECTKDYKLPGSDIVIEKGTPILVSVSGIQYDPQFYQEPEQFKPERYGNSSNGYGISLDMPFITFGDGPRNCLGLRLGKLQSKVAVIKLLQKFRFALDAQHLNKKLELSPQSATKCPVNGINLRVFPRL